ncbi:L-lactate utilization protein LutC [Paenibacillus phyllosphaerae]|uniref:L-lactate utilization protein LutC n=1 Tax=Paenibacillus phyllosphaerae TaxID=274593 RepID=A0A7W5FPN0_9BACL|nr:YqkE family protein [Paenibacillus phyllosphaerae]MBB3112541.1 L-lactate utilization protein LutC [Paenibacillus phyllosphaerae]
MAKKKRTAPAPRAAEAQDKPTTLADLLKPEMLSKLKEQASEMKATEERRKEEARLKAEEERKAEQKRRDNDFSYLLENSKMDWRKHK